MIRKLSHSTLNSKFITVYHSIQKPCLCYQPHRKFGKYEGYPQNSTLEPLELYEEIPYTRSRWEILQDIGEFFSNLISPIQLQINAMNYVHISWGFEWGLTFLFFGGLMRLISLGPGLYVHRNALRLAQISPELQGITEKIRNARANQKLSREDKKVIMSSYKKQKKVLLQKHDCSEWRAFVQVLTLPFLSSAFMAIRNFASYESELEQSSFVWLQDLSLSDPYFILPALCGCVFFVNLELNRSLNRGSRSGSAIYMTWLTRIGCFGGLFLWHNQPAAIFIYWLGMSLVGFLQPLLLRLNKFRSYFNFPPLSDSVKNTKSDWLINYLNSRAFDNASSTKTKRVATIRDFEVVFDQKK